MKHNVEILFKSDKPFMVNTPLKTWKDVDTEDLARLRELAKAALEGVKFR